MAFWGTSVEYSLHCLIWLVNEPAMPVSSRELAEMQGISVSFVAKLLPRLERAGIVHSVGGISGGYRLRRPAAEITVLSVIDAVEGRKPLFDCQNVRSRCILFGGSPPDWSTDGMCSIHAVMLKAEAMLREELSRTTLADLAGRANWAPGFTEDARRWFSSRSAARETARLAAIRDSRERALRGSADADQVVTPDPKQKPPQPEEDR
jgi:Rrf2 family protein